ncbi:phospholipase A(2)-like [Chelonus insularis]|uniref:phospholipase A(2)-like n=1 Tax=Chelonus insularis TaxID=460826 RepID=UPI00158DCBDD|nr:phospholipase A(2)-like [Chelonus insularis]
MNLMSILIPIILITQLTNSFVDAQDHVDGKVEENTEDTLDSSDNYVDTEIDMKITFRSSIEKFLQTLMMTLRRRQVDREANRFVAVMIALLPEPVKEILMLTSDKEKEKKDNIERRRFGETLNNYRNDFHAIYPGTLWCGGGNIAVKKDDVGVFSQTDICCREHDSCPYSVEAGKTFGLLKNNGMFARSACSCDLKFYKCLKKVNTIVSVNIGTTYFNILRPQCFGYSHPIKSCEKYDEVRRSDRKCIKYKFDDAKNKTLEWFDVPDF